MNQISQTQWADMPENFNAEAFKEQLSGLIYFLAGMMESNRGVLRYSFMAQALDALVTSNTFNEWETEARLSNMECYHTICGILEKLESFFTDEIIDNASQIETFIHSLVIPAQPAKQ